uniref:Uncharacterized protein n=1 Tax=Anopheles albimanus TaxID=7167 RepID=A0A182F5D7_ANOAL
MDYNISRLCRVCLEEGVFTSIFSTDLVAMAPADMLVMCSNIKVSKNDGLPTTICNNCMYRLGVAFHLKQQCENSDMRLRQYIGLMTGIYSNVLDKETMTDDSWLLADPKCDGQEHKTTKKKSGSRKRYKPKLPEERKKRGPKPMPKIPQTCYQCHKTFKCAAQLQMHLRRNRDMVAHKRKIHMNDRSNENYKCHECHKAFATLDTLNGHMRMEHGATSGPTVGSGSVAAPGSLMPPHPPQIQNPIALAVHGIGANPLGVGLGMLPHPVHPTQGEGPAPPPPQPSYHHSQMHPVQRLHPY